MYERLTVRDEYGNADIIGVDSADLQLNLGFKELNIVTNTLNRLAEFEDIGLSPEEIIGMKSLCEKTYDDLRHRVNTAEKEVEQLRAELERTKAERDAAVGDVEKMMAQDFHPSALRAKAVNTMAIAALREQAEREKGCEYCKVLTPDCCGGFFLPSIDPDCEADMVTITHCPMCGKRLEVEPFALKTRVCPMCEDCPDGCPVETPKDSRNIVTNADRIRSMSDEELAEFLRNIRDCGDYEELKFIGGVCMDYVSVIEWLKQPAKEE